MLVCFPHSIFPSSRLIGDPAIDVWNHAWGYWFVFQSILSGNLPLETDLIGAPAGGVLYYIDTPGAVTALPLTGIFGPAIGYNVVLMGRLALSGLATQGLIREFIEEDRWLSWIGGWATMTLPFLLCELSNGISEVCAIQWGICALWMAERATAHNQNRDWIGLGIFQGLTIAATFYYGLAFGLLLIVFIVGRSLESIRTDASKSQQIIWKAACSAGLALLVASPYAYTFWMSIQSDNRLVMRDNSLHEQLLRHNAVDPKIYWMWGDFQSVNLREKYGEPFVHTAFLRWSLLPFAIWAAITHRRLRLWGMTMLCSLLLGLGNYLWWNEEWVLMGGQMLSLPFDWIRQLLPQIAITHPLRLSIGGQVICVVLGIIGWKDLSRRFEHPWFLLIPLSLITIESTVGSSASWPLPHSNASISDTYALSDVNDDRGVLDLPAEVGTGMETSRYFWYQSLHGKPIPYTPDARLGSTRDLQTFKNFMTDGMKELPQQLDDTSIIHMRRTYQRIVVHPELDKDKAVGYRAIFTEAFGEPVEIDELLYWSLEPVDEEEIPPDLETKEITATPYSSDGEALVEHSCGRIPDLIAAHLNNSLSTEDAEMMASCHSDIVQYCIQRSKNASISIAEATLCLDHFAQSPSSDQQYALMHMFRHPELDFKLAIVESLRDHPNLVTLLPKERLQQLTNNEDTTLQQAIQSLFNQP